MFHVGKTGFLKVGIRHLILLPKAYAGVVHHLHHPVRSPMLFQQIVGLGEGAAKVDPCATGLLTQKYLKHLIKPTINLAVIRNPAYCRFYLIKKIGGSFRLIGFIDDIEYSFCHSVVRLRDHLYCM